MTLHKISFVVAVLLITTFTVSSQVQTIDFDKKVNPVTFLKTDKSILLVGDKALFSFNMKSKTWESIKQFDESINAATVLKEKIWIGTAHSLVYGNDKNEWVIWKGIKDGKIDVLSLKTDPKTLELLVSTADDGAFSIKDKLLHKTIVAHIRAEDFCRCGDFEWVGTNTGLMRIEKTGGIQLYTEEGVGGFEIPDNSVDRLYCLDGGHLSVVMQEAIAFLETSAKSVTSHAEGFEFLGKRGNKIFDQVLTPTGDFLFLTADGLILMRQKELTQQHQHGATIEVYSNAGKPKIAQIKMNTSFESIWKKGFFDGKGNLWLASDTQVLKLSKKEVAQLLK